MSVFVTINKDENQNIGTFEIKDNREDGDYEVLS